VRRLTQKRTYALIAYVLIAAIIVVAVLEVVYVDPFSWQLHTIGSVTTIGFEMASCSCGTPLLTSIDWGTFNAGDTHTVTGWALNTGNSNITLSFTVQNWNPTAAEQYIVFGWNYTGETIQAGGELPINLTCTVLSSVTGISSFSFDITITATAIS